MFVRLARANKVADKARTPGVFDPRVLGQLPKIPKLPGPSAKKVPKKTPSGGGGGTKKKKVLKPKLPFDRLVLSLRKQVVM